MGVGRVCGGVFEVGLELGIKVQETYHTPSREGQKGSPPGYIVIKTLNSQNTENILKT